MENLENQEIEEVQGGFTKCTKCPVCGVLIEPNFSLPHVCNPEGYTSEKN